MRTFFAAKFPILIVRRRGKRRLRTMLRITGRTIRPALGASLAISENLCVIARSTSDEAIQILPLALDCFASV
jgi:hypothetical protein